MKTVQATTHIECNVTCPHCNDYQNRFDELRDYFQNGEPRAYDIEAEIRCETCKEIFIVDLIEY